jgi:MIP family channel proteins
MDFDPLRRGFAEFVGTFTLVFIGAGSILAITTLFQPAISNSSVQGTVGGLTLVSVALAHGLAIAVMVSAVGHISGGHFNPAVTLGFVVTRRIAPSLALVYWAMQLVAATTAAGLLRWFFAEPTRQLTNLGAPGLGRGIDHWQGLVIELILTFFLVWAVWATAVDPRGAFKAIAGLAIGLTITIDVYMGGPLTGAAMNPARAFGPQLWSGNWGEGWIYYLGPALGALIAGLGYDYLYLRPPQPDVVGTPESGVEEPGPGQA